jgi:F0F1-type ATP synthase membrane subunit c/vacuolar-type H+-ATPase subunit K
VKFDADTTSTLRRAVAAALAVGAVLVPSACGGGGGGAALTQTGATRPSVTDPARTTTPATTAETPTEPTTTRPGITVTRTETQTQTETLTQTETQAGVTVQATITTVTGTTSTSSTPWGWIAAGLVLLGAIVIGFVFWKRSRDSASAWSRQLDDFTRRLLASLDDVLARGSVVTGQVEAFAAEALTLERKAPDEERRLAVRRLRAGLDELATVLESDRALRLASPPPSEEQLAYSAAIIRERVEQLQILLRPTLVTN